MSQIVWFTAVATPPTVGSISDVHRVFNAPTFNPVLESSSSPHIRQRPSSPLETVSSSFIPLASPIISRDDFAIIDATPPSSPGRQRDVSEDDDEDDSSDDEDENDIDHDYRPPLSPYRYRPCRSNAKLAAQLRRQRMAEFIAKQSDMRASSSVLKIEMR